MWRQTHWDATVGNRRQSPAPYHRKHWGSKFCQCLMLRWVTGSWLKRDCSRITNRKQWKSSQYWFHGDHAENWIPGINTSLSHKLFGPSISQFASVFAIYRGFVLSQLFVYFARTGALPQNPVRRGGSSLSCAVSRKGKHFVVQRALIQRRRIVKKSGKLLYNSQIWSYLAISHWFRQHTALSHTTLQFTYLYFTSISQTYLMYAIMQHLCNHYTFAIITLIHTYNMIHTEGSWCPPCFPEKDASLAKISTTGDALGTWSWKSSNASPSRPAKSNRKL